MARRTKDEAEKTRDAILNAAEKVFYKHGVTRTSLQEVAVAAGFTRGAVYWHFKDKFELCEAMLNRVFLPYEDVLERLEKSESSTPLLDLKKANCDSLKLLASDKRRQRVMTILTFRCEYVEDMSAIMERRRQCKNNMRQTYVRLFERAQKMKMLVPGITPAVAATSLAALMGGLIMGWLEGRKDFDLVKSGIPCVENFFYFVSGDTSKSTTKNPL